MKFLADENISPIVVEDFFFDINLPKGVSYLVGIQQRQF